MQNPGSTPDRNDLLAAELADLYLIEEELGRGGSATVYLAQDLRHGRRVALKVLHSALGAALGVERFQREIRTQARLQHPHILPLRLRHRGRAAVLHHAVRRGGVAARPAAAGRQAGAAAAVQLALEVASALAYAHRLGIIHRDLKPENIVLSPTGEAILADFGIAYALEQPGDAIDPDTPSGPRLTETGVTVGTPTYMSPEQAAGDEELTGRSDQYALAAVIYEALAGTPPFTGANARAILAKKLTSHPGPASRDQTGRARGGGAGAHAGALPTAARALREHGGVRAGASPPGSPTAITPVGSAAREPGGVGAATAPGALDPGGVAGAGTRGRRGLAAQTGRSHGLALPSARRRKPGCSRCCHSRTWATRRTSTSPTGSPRS